MEVSEDEIPSLRTIIPPRKQSTRSQIALRRSPRKNGVVNTGEVQVVSDIPIVLCATSNQRRLSPARPSPSKRSPLKKLLQASAPKVLIDDVPILPRVNPKTNATASAGNQRSRNNAQALSQPIGVNSLFASFTKLDLQYEKPDVRNIANYDPASRRPKEDPKPSHSRANGKSAGCEGHSLGRTGGRQRASRFVLDQAICDDDLANSSADDDGEDEDTDLSGFIVDDNAEISYQESAEEVDSEEDRRARRKMQKEKPRRKLQRGRRTVTDSANESQSEDELAHAFTNMRLTKQDEEHKLAQAIEVIDLVSPERKPLDTISDFDPLRSSAINLFDKFKAMKLSPPGKHNLVALPSKQEPDRQQNGGDREDVGQHQTELQGQFNTPPATPPQSPSKLKSPSKLLSPSKRGDAVQRSPHRQSMDAFWDLNEVNEWHDQYSPKKAPLGSPRKNRLAMFGIWSDAEEEDSFEGINETSDSLPSPCESPSKSRSRAASPVKAEKQRILAEKKAKQAEKEKFEAIKDRMARDLLHDLDKNVTGSRISKLSASTGGVQIVWSKTLRSTAGRANWRRTVTKATGSPVKGKAEESAPGTIVQHFANIELAIKIIDRQDRLINTLAHEFCHLANFMVSGIRDQPHGASFQNWARKVTTWMKSQNNVPEWKVVEVTTKHGYVIEWKYLWLCVGRDQTKAMEFLNIDEEDGCGAEYGRHSKSIDAEKHRCGRCKGRLVQVRPKPRASPVKKAEKKLPARQKGATAVEKMVEIIELSD